jgi:TamB, inner membrane protein subunit of TAM complex
VYNRAKLFIEICLISMLSILITLMAAQDDPWFKEKIEYALKSGFYDMLHVPVECRVAKLDLLQGAIFIEDIQVQSGSHDHWSLSCSRLLLTFSWWKLLTCFQLETELFFYQVAVQTEVTGAELALLEPIRLLMQAPSVIPFKLTRCLVYQARVMGNKSANNAKVDLIFSSDTLFFEESIKTTIQYLDGSIYYNNQLYCKNIGGTIALDHNYSDSLPQNSKINLSVDLPDLFGQCQRCLLTGYYKQNVGSFEFYSLNKLFTCTIDRLGYDGSKIVGNITVDVDGNYVSKYMPFSWAKDYKSKGNCKIHAYVALDILNKCIAYNGDLCIRGACYKDVFLEECTITFKGDQDKVAACYTLLNLGSISGKGHCTFSIKERLFDFNFILMQQTVLWSGKPFTIDECILSAECMQNGLVKVNYKLSFSASEIGDQRISIEGALKGHNNKYVTVGSLNTIPYKVTGSLFPFDVSSVLYKGFEQKGIAIKLYSHNKPKSLKGFIEYSLLRVIMKHFTENEFQGQGLIAVDFIYEDGHIRGSMSLENGSIKIPLFYNIITDFSYLFDIDVKRRIVGFKNIVIGLYRGAIKCSECALGISSTGGLEYAYVPIILNRCLLSWKKEFFGLLSGTVSLSYGPQAVVSINGFMRLEDSHLCSNLFSSQVQSSLVGTAIKPLGAYTMESKLNIILDTCQPLHVKTSFLDAQARMKVHISGSILNPEIEGTIDFSEGTLAFPYKPLYITEAKIHLVPDMIDDAPIELTAKNKIKKYFVTMHVTGSIKKPSIRFESLPYLQEEQIITLLLAGSQEGSLSLAMPSVIMHNLEELIFGPAESPSNFQATIKNMLKHLKNIRIMPTLPDQKGTIRGIVEVDINDRLRASVQNNVNLSEDTQIEVEYTISDDMSIRGIKDERGNVGGEVEMRWKF